jgi:uncharacterized protein YbjT (DUF2867 family)
MKLVITGSLGNISKPLIIELVQKGHQVTVISSKSERQNEIIALGALAAIGTIENVDFLTKTFANADIVYLMEPPINFFDQNVNTETYWTSIAKNYVEAILNTNVKKVIHLSSIGGHTDVGNGMLYVHHLVENILNQLPSTTAIKTMRPVGFYYNMFAFIPSIKKQNSIFQNYGGDVKEPWVSPTDIASVIVEEIEKPFVGRTVRYISSDEVSPNEVAKVLGEAIGNKSLKWIEVTDEQLLNSLKSIGMNPASAEGLVKMKASQGSGLLYEDYYSNKPTLGKVKLTEFAKEFKKVFNQ